MVYSQPSQFYYIPDSKSSGMIGFIKIISRNHFDPGPFDFKSVSKNVPFRNPPCISFEPKRAIFRDEGCGVRLSDLSNVFRATVIRVLVCNKENICLVIKNRLFTDLIRIDIDFFAVSFK
ncbi:hypothetical protein SDC9_142640 [bioreactor metagenome]|uniref:Uncharacterized protein n=1 Tax=bioreactor metagenome TaxID=1076179 RepID=A0A645E1P9_9ZZZZ